MRSLKSIHFVFIILSVIITGVATLLIKDSAILFDDSNNKDSLQNIYLIIAVIVTVIAILMGNFIYYNKLQNAKTEKNNDAKIKLIKSGAYLRWIMMIVAVLIVAILLYLSHLYLFLIFSGVLIISIISARVNKKSMSFNR